MTNVNFNAQALEIYKLLDNAETANGVNNGSDKLGNSIWNAFVGEGQSEDAQIGTENSKINNSINMENAVNSIVAYLRKNGTEKVQKALQNIGINWSPKDVYEEEIKSASGETSSAKSSKSSKAEQRVIDKHNKLSAERIKTTIIATTEKASNGMTYYEAKSKIAEIRKEFQVSLNSQYVYDPTTGESYFKRYTDDELPEFLDMVIKSNQGDLSGYDRSKIINELTQLKQECIKALEAKKELEAKHSELKTWDSKPIDLKTKESSNFDGRKVYTTQDIDGSKESKVVRPDGSVSSISTEYLGGGRVTTHYDKDGKKICKTISEKDDHGIKVTYVDKKGKVIGTLVYNLITGKKTLQDKSGNQLDPKSPQAQEIEKFRTSLGTD